MRALKPIIKNLGKILAEQAGEAYKKHVLSKYELKPSITLDEMVATFNKFFGKEKRERHRYGQEERKSHIASPDKSPEGTLKYCIDCASKHLGTAKILAREALQRLDKGEPVDLVLEKVRGAYEELMGAEDDTQASDDPDVADLNRRVRDLRKWFFESGAIAKADRGLVLEALRRISELNDYTYKLIEEKVHKGEPTCVGPSCPAPGSLAPLEKGGSLQSRSSESTYSTERESGELQSQTTPSSQQAT